MTTVVTRGAASAQALGYASSSAPVNYIEDIFSTYLYTGNGATQTITNGIDLSGKGGLTWIKGRTQAFNHTLVDTVRGATNLLVSNTSAAQATQANSLTAFTSTGFSIGAGSIVNYSGDNFASWTFREQPKFFDIVTYTGNGVAGRTISHNLGSVPGCIIVKQTSAAGQDWMVYHRSLAANGYLLLNSTGAVSTYPYLYGPTSTTFTVDSSSPVNANGATYVAYLFAHDAGGFGLTGTDNVISCGSYVGNGSSTGPVVTLGYEPQWVLVKRTTDGIEDWEIYDNMRGIVPAGADKILYPNSGLSEQSATRIQISATGFSPDGTAGSVNASGKTYIYIAIRRGPMAVPTDAAKVYIPIASTSATGTVKTTNFPVDLQIQGYRPGSVSTSPRFVDRLRGVSTNTTETGPFLLSSATDVEAASTNDTRFWNNTGFQQPSGWDGSDVIFWNFRRAPGFFDEVCYTGTGSATTITHNLSVVPELIIVKSRIATAGDPNWNCYSAALGTSFYMRLNQNLAKLSAGSTYWNSTSPTSTVFSVGDGNGINTSGVTYVAYLFATAAGVSKVGSYTGTGTTLQIDCGFTAGSRFVMIKRTDSTGDWYVWDSARGIVAGNDPYLLLNSTAVEVTSTDYVDTYSAGFEISSTAPAAINANGGAYIFLAIA